MTILATACAREPFCDWLTTSHPSDDAHGLWERLGPFLCGVGASPDPKGYVLPGGGLVYTRGRGRVSVASFSGMALGAIREAGGFHELLSLLASAPHRVTRLDIAYDTDEPGADVVPEIEQRGHSGLLRLSRKAIPPERVRWQRSIGPCGRVTGTVYVGKRGKAEIMARVYDKRAEVADRTGSDPGAPWTRYELELHCEGLTLRDAAEPAALFWHYGGGALAQVERPADVGPWEPRAEGFHLEPPPGRTPYAILRDRVGRSAELDAWIELADQMGKSGRTLLLSMVRQRLGLAQAAA